jgi:hypothetical protein
MSREAHIRENSTSDKDARFRAELLDWRRDWLRYLRAHLPERPAADGTRDLDQIPAVRRAVFERARAECPDASWMELLAESAGVVDAKGQPWGQVPIPTGWYEVRLSTDALDSEELA